MQLQQTSVQSCTTMSDSASQRRGSNAAEGKAPVVIPSSQLDAHLHSMAAEIIKRRYSKQTELTLALPQVHSHGDHDDDLMTPPNVLLERASIEAEKYTIAENKDKAVEEWTRCTALARIVHGNTHWVFANAHIQLGKAYQNKDLLEQALIHATKGRDILLTPGSHVMSHDPPPEAIHSLSVAHCIIGSVLTEQGRLTEGEKALLKAEKCSEKLSRLPGDHADVQLDLDIVSSMGRLCVKKGEYKLAKDCFSKALDLSKAADGPTNSKLVLLLRGLATAQLYLSDYSGSLVSLDEALKVAKENYGEDSESVAEVLVRQARARQVVGGDKDLSSDTVGTVEELLKKAHSIYSTLYGSDNEKTISCKEELCCLLSSNKETQEKAIPLIKELLSAKRQRYGEQSEEVARSLKMLGTMYLMKGNVTQAKRQLEKAREAFSYSLGAKHKETCHIVKTLEIISGSDSIPSKQYPSTKPIFKTVV